VLDVDGEWRHFAPLPVDAMPCSAAVVVVIDTTPSERAPGIGLTVRLRGADDTLSNKGKKKRFFPPRPSESLGKEHDSGIKPSGDGAVPRDLR